MCEETNVLLFVLVYVEARQDRQDQWHFAFCGHHAWMFPNYYFNFQYIVCYCVLGFWECLKFMWLFGLVWELCL